MTHFVSSKPHNCLVVIIDDDADDREFIKQALNDNSFKGDTLEAENGLSLIQTLNEKKEHTPDLLILDLNMPYMSGFEVMTQLNKDPAFSKIPRVILTSSSKNEDSELCNELGCVKYYRKPFTLDGYDEIAVDMLSILRDKNFRC